MVKVPSPAAARAPTHRSRPACSGLPSGPEASALTAWMPQSGCSMAFALWCLPKVTHTTPPLIIQEEELFGLSFEEVLAQEKGAGLDLRGSGGMAGSLR